MDSQELKKFQNLKTSILEKRKQLSKDEYLQLSKKAFSKLLEFRLFSDALHILFFHSKQTNKEIDTINSIKYSLSLNKRISLPKTYLSEKKLHTYLIRSIEGDLELGTFGIYEPKIEKCKETTFDPSIDLILVPGALFDEFGGRWGYGAGYYDRFLSEYREVMGQLGEKMPPIFGYAFDFQMIVGRLPQKKSDYPLDGVITDSKIYVFNQNLSQNQ
jgi:5-formyltetrahydrofolate cyclo-ligase